MDGIVQDQAKSLGAAPPRPAQDQPCGRPRSTAFCGGWCGVEKGYLEAYPEAGAPPRPTRDDCTDGRRTRAPGLVQGVARHRGGEAAEAGRAPAAREGFRAVRDRLRPVGPAAHRHLRRGRRAPRWCATPSPAVRPADRLLAFSDDMDGLRKVPDNVPNKEMLAAHLGKPLTAIPDPFGTHASFGAPQQRAAARVPRRVRLRVRVQAAPPSATAPAGSTRRCYACCERYDEVKAVILPTLGEERRATYSPVPADLAQDRPRAAGAADRGARPGAGTVVFARRGRHADRGAGDRRPLQAAVEGRLGDALVRRSTSTTRCRART